MLASVYGISISHLVSLVPYKTPQILNERSPISQQTKAEGSTGSPKLPSNTFQTPLHQQPSVTVFTSEANSQVTPNSKMQTMDVVSDAAGSEIRRPMSNG